jgi:hypothetical protein
MHNMTKDETLDIAEILLGYDEWRHGKVRESESASYDPLSVSAYLDSLALQRAYDAVQAIKEVYADTSIPWETVDAYVREILGVK